jgi:hypothetical protein
VSSATPELAPLDQVIRGSMALAVDERPANPEELAKELRAFLRAQDSTEVARRLGQRAREARELEGESRPWQTGDGLTGIGTPSDPERTPATPDRVRSAGTRTFAASRNFSEWTRRISSAPPPPGETPPAGHVSGSATRRISSSAPPSAHDDQPRRTGRSAQPVLLAALAAGLLISGVVWLRSAPAPAGASRATASARPPEALSAAPAMPAPRPRPAASDVETPVVAPARVQTPPSSLPEPRSSASVERAPRLAAARLSLTALPGASVTVGGNVYSTPVAGLDLPPGRYQVTFRNATWDAPVSTDVELAPGGQRRVHADFTHEPPRVIVR